MTKTFRNGTICLALVAAGLIYASRSSRMEESFTLASVTDARSNPMQLLVDQPDFTAEQSEHHSETYLIAELRGLTTSYSVAKRGLRYRVNRAVVISYCRPNEPDLLLYPRSREYVESPRLGVWSEKAASPSVLVSEQGATLLFESLADEELDGHKCAKIQVSMPKEAAKSSFPTRVVYFLARDLRNLVIRIEVTDALGVTGYALKNISFEVPKDLFDIPSGYRKSTSDPTAEYRLLDHFQLPALGYVRPDSFRNALLEKLPLGTPEEQIYRYLQEGQLGKDRLSSYQPAQQAPEIVCRIEYDPSLPGPIKKHFAVVFLLDQEKRLRDVKLNSWISAP